MTTPSSSGAGPARALLWSPSLQGHRLVYCRVFAEILASLGYEVAVAADLSGVTAADGPRLDALRRGPVAEVFDAGPDLSADRTTLAPVGRFAGASGASVVLLTEADDLLEALAARPVAEGSTKLVALFIRTINYQYDQEPSPAARLRRLVRARARAAPGRRQLHRTIGERTDAGIVPLVLDELYAGRHASSCRWLPDIFRDPGDGDGGASDVDSAEVEQWRPRLSAFIEAAGGRPVFVYVGTNQHRRGYDGLLRLALDEDGCVIHCGRFVLDGESSDDQVRAMRAALAARGALFETGGPYRSPSTAELFLRAARCVVLPYRHHDGSSGVMLQALAAGRPVLVPDRGLMAHRVNAFGLGATYRDGDTDDLRRRFRELESAGPEGFGAALAAFMDYFTPAQTEAAVSLAVTGTGPGARLPQALHAGSGVERGRG